jgi:hypothetical protein
MCKHRFGAVSLGVILAIRSAGTGVLGQTVPGWMQTNALQAHAELFSQAAIGELTVGRVSEKQYGNNFDQTG